MNNLCSQPKRHPVYLIGMDPAIPQSYPDHYAYILRAKRDDGRRPKIARVVRHLLVVDASFRR